MKKIFENSTFRVRTGSQVRYTFCPMPSGFRSKNEPPSNCCSKPSPSQSRLSRRLSTHTIARTSASQVTLRPVSRLYAHARVRSRISFRSNARPAPTPDRPESTQHAPQWGRVPHAWLCGFGFPSACLLVAPPQYADDDARFRVSARRATSRQSATWTTKRAWRAEPRFSQNPRPRPHRRRPIGFLSLGAGFLPGLRLLLVLRGIVFDVISALSSDLSSPPLSSDPVPTSRTLQKPT